MKCSTFLTFFLVIKHAMAVTFKIRVSALLLKLSAHTFILFCPFQTTGAVTTGALQSLFYAGHHFPIFIESDFAHILSSNSFFLFYHIVERISMTDSALSTQRIF